MTDPPRPPLHLSSADLPPRLAVALALIAASALTQVAAVLAMVANGVGDVALGGEMELLTRIQFGTRFLDLGVLLLVPLAVLLARLVEPRGDAPVHPGVHSVLLAASAVGAAVAFLLLLRVLADLGGGDLMPGGVATVLLIDAGHLLVAVAGTWWAYRELQGPRPQPTPPADASQGAGPVGPPPGTWTTAPGFPSGPPPPPGSASGHRLR